MTGTLYVRDLPLEVAVHTTTLSPRTAAPMAVACRTNGGTTRNGYKGQASM
jgi:hypothetical protein